MLQSRLIPDVIPAQAGIQEISQQNQRRSLDSGLRRNDIAMVEMVGQGTP